MHRRRFVTMALGCAGLGLAPRPAAAFRADEGGAAAQAAIEAARREAAFHRRLIAEVTAELEAGDYDDEQKRQVLAALICPSCGLTSGLF